jgi:AraC-like DNA-binding protein
MAVRDWLKVDRAVTSQLRVHGWEKETRERFDAPVGAHDSVEIAIIESGSVAYAIGSQTLSVRERQVVIVPRGVEHATSFLTPVRALALGLGADFVAEIADAMGPEVPKLALLPGVLDEGSTHVRSLISVLADEVNGGACGHTRVAEALAESIVIEVLRKAPRDAARRYGRDPRVAQAVAQMSACFAEPLGIDDLAKTARMSRFHFSRLFRDEMGCAPYQFLLHLRLAKAAELLRGGHHSVTEAALAAGFSDLSRFASMFKKHTGKRPSDLLREAQTA